jgi:hypothetical protein
LDPIQDLEAQMYAKLGDPGLMYRFGEHIHDSAMGPD